MCVFSVNAEAAVKSNLSWAKKFLYVEVIWKVCEKSKKKKIIVEEIVLHLLCVTRLK